MKGFIVTCHNGAPNMLMPVLRLMLHPTGTTPKQQGNSALRCFSSALGLHCPSDMSYLSKCSYGVQYKSNRSAHVG